MPVCAKKLLKNLRRNCETALVQGVKEKYFIGHTSHVSALAFDSTNRLLVTGITMKAGEKLAIYEGYDLSNKPSINAINRTDYGVFMPHQYALVIYSNDAATKLEIETLLKSKDLFVIYQKEGIAGEFEAMGLLVGMRATSVTYAPADESKGAFLITLEAPDAATLPHTIKHTTTNVDDTETYLTGLAFADV